MDFFRLLILNWNSGWPLLELFNCKLGMALAINSAGFNFPLSAASNNYLDNQKVNENKKNKYCHSYVKEHIINLNHIEVILLTFLAIAFLIFVPISCVYLFSIVRRSTDEKQPNLYAVYRFFMSKHPSVNKMEMSKSSWVNSRVYTFEIVGIFHSIWIT